MVGGTQLPPCGVPAPRGGGKPSSGDSPGSSCLRGWENVPPRCLMFRFTADGKALAICARCSSRQFCAVFCLGNRALHCVHEGVVVPFHLAVGQWSIRSGACLVNLEQLSDITEKFTLGSSGTAAVLLSFWVPSRFSRIRGGISRVNPGSPLKHTPGLKGLRLLSLAEPRLFANSNRL